MTHQPASRPVFRICGGLEMIRTVDKTSPFQLLNEADDFNHIENAFNFEAKRLNSTSIMRRLT